MPEAFIDINRHAALQVLHVGVSQTPVIIIDDFATDTTALIETACTATDYGPEESSRYPGLRAKLPLEYLRTVLNQLFPLLFQVYQVQQELGMKPVNAVYSLISTAETDLAPGQCVPHFDSPRAHYLALLHYLNPGPFCDTGLFRHRATGLERIDEATLEQYNQSRRAEFPPAPAYVKGSNEQFELYQRLAYRANRLVVYPGSLLHSGLVNPAVDINPDPRSGRLTANIFVDFFPLATT
jgi:hypothetical protein